MKGNNLAQLVFDYIIKVKSISTDKLISHFQTLNYSKAGVYKSLHILEKEGKVFWNKSHVSPHLLWLHMEINRLVEAMPSPETVYQSYGKDNKEKKIYKVKSLEELENLYSQIFFSIVPHLSDASHVSNTKNFFFYYIHNYTYVAVSHIDDQYIDYMNKHNITMHVLVGSHSSLDKKLIAYNKMNMTKVYLIDKKWDFIINLIGDYVIKISLDKKIQKQTDIIFDTMNIEEAKYAMQTLYTLPSKCKITAERNPALARIYEKEFRKYFVIKD